MISNLSNLIARRDLLRELVLTDLRASTAESKLGWIWWLLDPLIMMLIYWGIVSGIFGRGQQYAPYPIFILCALITWKHFSSSMMAATRILRGKGALIKSVPFPTLVLPISVVLSEFAYFFFGLLVVLCFAVALPNRNFSGDWLPLLQAVPLMVFQVLITIGLCLGVTCLGALFRDVELLMRYALRAGFFLSPSLYGLDTLRERLFAAVDEPYASIAFSLYMLNPFAVIISGYRQCLFYGTFMPAGWWLLLLVETGVVLVLGYRIYHYYDRRVIKFL